MLDEAHHWAKTQFGSADLGDARRTGRLVSTMAAIAGLPTKVCRDSSARSPDQGGVSAVRLRSGHPGGGDGPASGAVPGRGGAASDRADGAGRHDARFLDPSQAPGRRPGRRRSRHRVPGAQLPGRAALGRDAGPGPPDDLGATAQGCDAADPGVSGLGRNGRDDRPSTGGQRLHLGRGPWRRRLRASGERPGYRLGCGRSGGPGPTAGRRAADR